MLQQARITISLMTVLVVLTLLSACATKTAPESEINPPAAATGVGTTDLSQQPDALGVGSQPVQSGPVADHEALAGLERVHFDYNQFTLDAPARVTLERNAVFLRNNPALKVVIEGHCDERGSDEYNLALGERRAVAVKNYLVSLGIAADRLRVISYGEEMPLVAEANEEAWAKNRRAEFKAVR